MSIWNIKRKNPCLWNPISSSPHPPPPPSFHKKFLDLPLVWCPVGVSSVSGENSYLMRIFFLHAVDGVQVEPMVSRETRPQHQVKKSSHCIAWKYGTSFILGICSLFCILLEQYFPVYLYPFDILLDGEKHSTMTCQSRGPKPIKLEVTLPTIGPLHLPQRRGVGSWIHYDLKLS